MRKYHRAFTLVELLVVISIIAMLLTILMPALTFARNQAKALVCRSNLKQLFISNIGYSLENKDSFVRAAPDIYSGFGIGGGKQRWHGIRLSDAVSPDPKLNTFDPAKGPLVQYLGDGKVKKCAGISKFVDDGAKNAFESGCGGYGYNYAGLGTRIYRTDDVIKAWQSSMKTSEISKTSSKVMFTDAAFIQGNSDFYIIENSFCEPPNRASFSGGTYYESGVPTPTIHFRHNKKTNVAWCDGHISSEKFAFSKLSSNKLNRYLIGWFGPKDNTLFRPN